jgi:hypothetical protein
LILLFAVTLPIVVLGCSRVVSEFAPLPAVIRVREGRTFFSGEPYATIEIKNNGMAGKIYVAVTQGQQTWSGIAYFDAQDRHEVTIYTKGSGDGPARASAKALSLTPEADAQRAVDLDQ